AVVGEGIFVFDLGSGEEVSVFGGVSYSLAFTPDGSQVVVGDYGGKVNVHSFPDGKLLRTLSGHASHVRSLVLTSDGKHVITGSDDKTVKIWELSTGREIRTLSGRSGEIVSTAYNADGDQLVFAVTDGTARVWDLKLGQQTAVLSGHKGPVLAAAFSPDGRYVVTGSEDKTVRVWDMEKRGESRVLKGHSLGVMDIAFTPDGKHVFSAGGSRYNKAEDKVRMWHLRSGTLVWTMPSGHQGGVRSVAVSPDGRYLAVGSFDASAELWDLRGRRKARDLPKGYYHTEDRLIRFSPDGKLLAMKSFAGVLVQEVGTWKTLKEGGSIEHLFAFMPDSRSLVVANTHGSVLVKELPSLKIAKKFRTGSETAESVAVSPDGKHIAVGGKDGVLRLLDSRSGKEVAALVAVGDDWVAAAPGGFFDGSDGGMKSITWTAGSKSYPLEAFSEGYYTPGLLGRLIVGEAIKGAKLPDLSQGFDLPPLVKIASPERGASFESESLEVRVVATDQGGGVDEIRLYHNGKAVGTAGRDIKIVPKGGTRTESFRVALVEGRNSFRAVALSKDRIEGNPDEITVTLKGPEKRSTLHVFVVGINEYKNPALNLNYARPDAKGIADFFSATSGRLFSGVKRYELFDSAATKEGIEAKLAELSGSAARDVVVIYLAGHGDTVGNTWYFVPHEVVYPELEEELTGKSVSSEDLQTHIKAIGAKKVLVLVDACKSGGALLAWAGRGLEERKALAHLARASGVYIVAAAMKEQIAAEVKDLGHGVFTHTVLQGLRGEADGSPADNVVTVGELLSYVESTLPEISKKYRTQAQYPVKYAGGMDFPITTK
ncbi:caspase family protein, partial [Elusimicrobiota bacterium]